LATESCTSVVLLRGQAVGAEDVEQVVRSDRNRVERGRRCSVHRRLELHDLRRQGECLDLRVACVLRRRPGFGSAKGEIRPAAQAWRERAHAEGDGEVLYPGRPIAEHIAADRAVLLLEIRRRHRLGGTRDGGGYRKIAGVGQTVAE
jgi:hypothetical protein